MDWKRFKKIIIIVLILINIVFLVYFVHIKRSDSRVSEETQENVISVLKKNNIIIDEEIFPENKDEYSACYVSRLTDLDSSFAKMLMGENGTMSEKDEIFTMTYKTDKKVPLDEENVEKACFDYMTEHGINSGMYKAKKIEISGKSAKAEFSLFYDDCLFFDSFLKFEITGKGIEKVTGRNIVRQEENISSYKEKPMPVESIMVAIQKDKKTDKPIEITKMEFGYYLGKSAGVYVSVLSLPVWKVSFEDKSYLYYDARNGNLINM